MMTGMSQERIEGKWKKVPVVARGIAAECRCPDVEDNIQLHELKKRPFWLEKGEGEIDGEYNGEGGSASGGQTSWGCRSRVGIGQRSKEGLGAMGRIWAFILRQ